MRRELGWNSQYLSNELNSKLTPRKLPLMTVTLFGGEAGMETFTAWTGIASNAQAAMTRARVNCDWTMTEFFVLDTLVLG